MDGDDESVDEASPELGWVAPAVSAEFPGLGLQWTSLSGPSGKSPPAIRRRLAELSDRFAGGHAVHMRERPIPWAYRVFFRQIGLDPDSTRTPVEELALQRMKHGSFRSASRLDDAIAIATVETGVALRAFDAAGVSGLLGIRLAAPGEQLEGHRYALEPGTLVIADAERPLGLLFGVTAQGRGVEPGTPQITLAAIVVHGVPQIAVEEALWTASTVMAYA